MGCNEYSHMFNISDLIPLKKGNMFLIQMKEGKISFDKNAKYADFYLGDDLSLNQIIDSNNNKNGLKFCVKVSKFRFSLSSYPIQKVFNDTGYFNLKINMQNWPENFITFNFNVLPGNL